MSLPKYDIEQIWIDPVVAVDQAVFRAACPSCRLAIEVVGPELFAAYRVNKWAELHNHDERVFHDWELSADGNQVGESER